MTASCAVSVGVADIRREPDPGSELVTQALMNVPVIIGAISGEWTQVTLSDYNGWICTSELSIPASERIAHSGFVAVVSTTHTSLFVHVEGDETSGVVYLSTALPILDNSQPARLKVALPGDYSAWLGRDAVNIRRSDNVYAPASISTVTAYARSFLGVPYLWGGTCWEGIDCSGFVQLCYRMGGRIIPRDADQQHDALSQSVGREEMREGDLIFFGSSAITHVGMALNNKEYIHAEGTSYNCVVINSFELEDAHYNQRLGGIIWAIKRVVV